MLPLVYTVDVLPQPDMLLIGLSSVALRHRQVTSVTLVLDTFKLSNLCSPCAELEHGVMDKGRVQHKLSEFVSGL